MSDHIRYTPSKVRKEKDAAEEKIEEIIKEALQRVRERRDAGNK